MTNRLELNWNLDGFVDEQRYYRSEAPIDVNNLPVPRAVLAGDIRSYTDTAIELDKTYFISVGAVKSGSEKLSAVASVNTQGVSQTLKSLFAGAVKGMAYNFQDIRTLWQDTAGTIPVTAVDQSVARVDDLSGNNNHIIQTDVSKRPQLKQDAEGFYLWFDGTKAMYSAIVVDFNGLYDFTTVGRFSKEVATTAAILEASANYNSSSGSFAMFQEQNNISLSAHSPYGYNSAAAAMDPDSTFVGIVQPLKNPKISPMRINGVEKTITGAMNQHSSPLSNHQIFICSRGGTSLFLKSKVRSIALVGKVLTSSEILNVENLMS